MSTFRPTSESKLGAVSPSGDFSHGAPPSKKAAATFAQLADLQHNAIASLSKAINAFCSLSVPDFKGYPSLVTSIRGMQANLPRVDLHNLLPFDTDHLEVMVKALAKDIIDVDGNAQLLSSPKIHMDASNLEMELRDLLETQPNVREEKSARVRLQSENEQLRQRELERGRELEYHKQLVEATKAEVASLSAALETARKDRDKAAAAAAKVGVDVHAGNFEELCKRNSIQSWCWAGVVGVAGALAILYVYFSLRHLSTINPSLPAVLHEVTPRVLIFTVVYFVIVWAARNFSAARHNHTINSHRAAALKSFDAFTSATEGDKELRLAILKQMTTAIFESQPTAYLKEEQSGKEGNLIQVFADAVRSHGKGDA
jgi:hypothetical protein